MVMDSLRYWVEVCHVDGFRFDLASTLGRGPNGFDRGAAFFAAVRQDPVLTAVKLIAEPWDIGLGGYQVGVSRPAGRNGTIVSASPFDATGLAPAA
jgi:glycogen operon protein